MLKWSIRLILISVIFIIAVFLIFSASYYSKSYLPQKENITTMISEINVEERHLSESAQQLLNLAINGQSCMASARVLERELEATHPINGMMGQHLGILFWSIFICQDFDEQQRLSVVASRWPYFSRTNKKGLNIASAYLYQRSLSELNLEQLANVIACQRSEFICFKEGKRTQLAQSLLEKYQAVKSEEF